MGSLKRYERLADGNLVRRTDANRSKPAAMSSSTLTYMPVEQRSGLILEVLNRLHRYVRDSGAANPAAYFQQYDPHTTGAVSISAFRSALSAFHVPAFAVSPSNMEVLCSYYPHGGDPSMLSYLMLLDDMSKMPQHLEANWRNTKPHAVATTSTIAQSTVIKLEKLERQRGELCMLQQKKMAVIAGLALQAKAGIAAHHSAVGKPAGSLAFTKTSGKRVDEVRKGYKEALKVAEAQANDEELTLVKAAQAMDTIALHACPTSADEDFGFNLAPDTDWETELKLVDERIIAINKAIAATTAGGAAAALASRSPSPSLATRASASSPSPGPNDDAQATGRKSSPTTRSPPSNSVTENTRDAEQARGREKSQEKPDLPAQPHPTSSSHAVPAPSVRRWRSCVRSRWAGARRPTTPTRRMRCREPAVNFFFWLLSTVFGFCRGREAVCRLLMWIWGCECTGRSVCFCLNSSCKLLRRATTSGVSSSSPHRHR